MPPPTTSEFDRELRELEAEIKRLEVEYNLFFAGRLPRLPWETRARVEALVKRYDRCTIQNTAERFRFQGLQSRFSAFCELWERSLKRERARGRARARPQRAAADPAAAARQPAGEPAPSRAAEPRRDDVACTIRRRGRQGAGALRAADARRGARPARPVPFERFQEVVQAQVAKLGEGRRRSGVPRER